MIEPEKPKPKAKSQKKITKKQINKPTFASIPLEKNNLMKKTDKQSVQNMRLHGSNNFANTIIVTDDLAIKSYSTVPLKLNSQYLTIDLSKILKTVKTPVYTVDTAYNGHIFFTNRFKKLLAEYDNIVYLASTLDLSTAFEDAIMARSMLLEQEKNRVHIVNTKTISAGVIILKSYLNQLLYEGLTIEEALPKLEKYIEKTEGNIILKNKKNIFLKRDIINFDEHVTINNRYTIDNDSKIMIDNLLNYEFNKHITKIYITYTSKYLLQEAESLKRYIELKLRYFNTVEVCEDIKDINGFQHLQGIGLYLG
jgi:hypothetical protein